MNYYFRIVLVLACFCSCSSDLDFNQAENTIAKPVILVNLVSFDVTAQKFSSLFIQQFVLNESFDFTAFNDVNFSKTVLKTDLFFEFTNTMNRFFQVEMLFLDKRGTVLTTISVNVPTSSIGNKVTRLEVFENTRLDLLKQTSSISCIVGLVPTVIPIVTNSGNFKLSSSATLYFKL